MRTFVIPLLALSFASAPASAGEAKGALGSLEQQAPEGYKPKKALEGKATYIAVYAREHWSSLGPKEWASCPEFKDENDGGIKRAVGISKIKSKDGEFKHAAVGDEHHLCLGGAWLKVDGKPAAVSLAKDGREAIVVIPKLNFSRVRAQDITKKSKALKDVAWMRADLFLETEASNPIELVLEPKTGLAGNGVALALESLADAGLLGDSVFKDAKNRALAEKWVNKSVVPEDEKAKARLYTRESSMATATGDVLKSGIELYFKRPMASDPQRISERALLETGGNKKK